MFIIDMEPAWIVELESDARHKFSRHLVIKIPGKAFANNLHAGCFVNNVCQAAIDPGTGVSSLQVAKVKTTVQSLLASGMTASLHRHVLRIAS